MLRIKTSTILVHVVGWLLLLSLPLLFDFTHPDRKITFADLFQPYHILFTFIYIVIFYLNIGILLPKLYFKKYLRAYWLVTILILVLVLFFEPFEVLIIQPERRNQNFNRFVQSQPPPDFLGPGKSLNLDNTRPFNSPNFLSQNHLMIDFVSGFLYIIVIGLSINIKNSQRLYAAEQRAGRAEADKANAELSFLKAQIHPHFLFNTLNNIYSMAVTNNVNTAVSLLRLSNIMRYVTDEVAADFVPLKDEVNYIMDYIELQRLRLGENVHVELNVSGEMDGIKIVPLILITFIENVFKHGVSKTGISTIEISLTCDKHNIIFKCSNRIYVRQMLMERPGVGITNTKRRLEHMYPWKHLLSISSQPDFYTVQLILTY